MSYVVLISLKPASKPLVYLRESIDATSLLRPAVDSTDDVREEVVYQVVGRLSDVASIPRALDASTRISRVEGL